MQQIGHRARQEARVLSGSPAAVGNPVLPRLLRKPVRQFRRLLNGGFHVTGRGLVLAGTAFAVLAGVSGIVANGGSGQIMARLAPSLGIAIRSFEVSGNREVSEIEIAQLLAPDGDTSILNFNVEEARKALTGNPWIFDARVSRVYPDKLAIEVSERVPFALWQGETGLQLIDREGNVLAAYDGRDNSLPLLVGKGAESGSADFIDIMNKFPGIASRARAYIKVGERRWDVELENGVTIMLPENAVERELARLDVLDREQEILSRDIERIDLRLEDRMVLRLSQASREVIEEKRQEQLKLLASSEKERNT